MIPFRGFFFFFWFLFFINTEETATREKPCPPPTPTGHHISIVFYLIPYTSVDIVSGRELGVGKGTSHSNGKVRG